MHLRISCLLVFYALLITPATGYPEQSTSNHFCGPAIEKKASFSKKKKRKMKPKKETSASTLISHTRQGPIGPIGPMGPAGPKGPAGTILSGAAQGPTGRSDAVETRYMPNGTTYQLVTMCNGFPTTPGGAIEFVPADLSSSPLPPTKGGYFSINSGGAGVYLLHYSLTGAPNLALRAALKGQNVQAWIMLRVTSKETVNYYGATPFVIANSLSNDPDPLHASVSLMTAAGQYQLSLQEGDQVSLMLYMHIISGQEPGSCILYLDPDNIVDIANNNITLSSGGTLSLIKIGEL